MRLFFVAVAVATWLVGLGDASGQTITGRVTNRNTGAGLVGFDLDVFSNGVSVTITGGKTTTNGAFSISLPGPGVYTVRVDANASSSAAPEPFVDQYYRSATVGTLYPSEATAITVSAGQTVSGINISLPQSSVVMNGRVQFNGTNAPNVNMDLYVLNPTTSAREFLGSLPATTVANGNYQFGYLAPGTYFIRAKPNPALGQFYVGEYYSAQTALASATGVLVGTANVNNINLNLLQQGGAISGKATASAGGAGLAGLDLDLYDLAGNRVDVTALTQADGSYSLGPVPAGQYKIRIDPTIAQNYPRLYFSNQVNLTVATPFSVSVGQITPNINFVLPVAGSISGRMTAAVGGAPLLGIDLDLFDLNGQRVDLTAVTDAGGLYQLGPMPPGQYRLRADPGAKQGYMTQYYLNKPVLASGDLLNVPPGPLTNINFVLAQAGFIEGTVKNSLAQPLLGIDLDLYDAVTNTRLTQSAATNAAGYYLFGPVPVGNYKLRCDPTPAQFLAVEYANSKETLSLADVLAIQVSGAVVDFTLDSGGTFLGTVLNQWNGTPIGQMDLDVYRETSPGVLQRMDQSAKSAADGSWSLGPLPLGTYIIRADATNYPHYLTTWYGDAPRPEQAARVNFSAGLNVTGLTIHVPLRAAVEAAWTLYQ